MRSSQKYAQQSRVGVAVKSKCGGENMECYELS